MNTSSPRKMQKKCDSLLTITSIEAKTDFTMKTETAQPTFGKEEKGRTFQSSWFEIQYRNKNGDGGWYCTPTYRHISEHELSAKLKEFIANRNATKFNVGGMVLEFIDKDRTRLVEVRIVKRESSCTVIDVMTIQSRCNS